MDLWPLLPFLFFAFLGYVFGAARAWGQAKEKFEPDWTQKKFLKEVELAAEDLDQDNHYEKCMVNPDPGKRMRYPPAGYHLRTDLRKAVTPVLDEYGRDDVLWVILKLNVSRVEGEIEKDEQEEAKRIAAERRRATHEEAKRITAEQEETKRIAAIKPDMPTQPFEITKITCQNCSKVFATSTSNDSQLCPACREPA